MKRIGVRSTFNLGLVTWVALFATPIQARPIVSRIGLAEVRSSENEKESELRQIREQELAELKSVLTRRLDAHQRADLYFRWAEIALESYRQDYLIEGRIFEKRLEDSGGRLKGSIDHSASKTHLRSAIQASQKIVDLKLAYGKLDRVYYFLGYNHGELGNLAQSDQWYRALVRRFPESPFAREAYSELGLRAFKAQDFKSAETYLNAAIRARDGTPLPGVMHKLAWVYYRTRRVDQAIGTLKQAIEQAQSNSEKYLSILDEAMRDMAVFMTETGRVSDAIEFFRKSAKSEADVPRALQSLAEQFERAGRLQFAVQVYEALLRSAPSQASELEARYKLLDFNIRQDQLGRGLDRVKDIEPLGKGSDPTAETAYQNIKALIRRTGTEQHERYRKLKKNRTPPAEEIRRSLLAASAYYEFYLQKFLPEGDEKLQRERNEVSMYLAELRTEQGDERASAKIYESVLRSADDRYVSEAAVLWTAALKKSLSEASGSEKAAQVKLFVEAADELEKILPGHAESREAQVQAAQVLAGLPDERENALDRATGLAKKYPATSQGHLAAQLELQILAEQNDLKAHESKIEDSLSSLRTNEALMKFDAEYGKGAVRGQIKELESRLAIGKIAALEKSGDLEDAAELYEKFARATEDPKKAERAYQSAIHLWNKNAELEKATVLLWEWEKRAPRSPELAEKIRTQATLLLIADDFKGASKLFRWLGVEGKDPEAYLIAGRLYGDLANGEEALKNKSDFIKNTRSREDAALVMLEVATELSRAEKNSDALQLLNQCVSGRTSISLRCEAARGDLFLKLKDFAGAEKTFKNLALLAKSSGGPYLGYARFQLAYFAERRAGLKRVSGSGGALKTAVEQRLRALKPLYQKYRQVVETPGPWGISALYRLARLTLDFSEELEVLKDDKESLSPTIAALNSQAEEVLLQAYDLANVAETLSPDLPNIAESLIALGAPRPKRAQGSRGGFLLLSGAGAEAPPISGVRARLSEDPKRTPEWLQLGHYWLGNGHWGAARLAFDRVLALDPKNVEAINNLSLVFLAGEGEEDWESALRAWEGFRRALRIDEAHVAVKQNLAQLFNYYRLFKPAKELWTQVNAIRPLEKRVWMGLGVATLGAGDGSGADKAFEQASELEGAGDLFAETYFKAAKAYSKDKPKCLSILEDSEEGAFKGFEKNALKALKNACASKERKSK